MFRDGRAGRTNLENALLWSAKAAEAGLAEAQYRTALHYARGEGTQTNLIQAMKWSTLAARQSHQKAAQLKDELRTTLTPFQRAFARRLTSDFALGSVTNSSKAER
jgi:TPR repeat protein